jgi:HD-like signal output (HDOD) protein
MQIGVQRALSQQKFKSINSLLSEDDQMLLALKLAMSLKLEDFGSIGGRLICCETFEDWLSTLSRHIKTLGLQNSFIKLNQNNCALEIGEHKIQAIFNFGIFLRLLKYSFGDHLPTLIFFIPSDFSQPILIALSELNVSCEHYQSSSIKFKTDKKLLGKHLPDANKKAARVFEKDIQRTISISTHEESLVAEALHVIKTFTPASNVNQTEIARQLNLSERTFVRRLQKEGTSFREIFNEVRNSQALSLLFQGKTIEYISDLQGFSERATFERAFKKWQGITPVAMQSRFARLNNETALDDIIEADQIPNLPGVVSRLLSMIREDKVHLDELIALVEQDPILVAKILSIANSGAFGYLKADSIKGAVLTILGTQKLQALVLSLLSTSAFSVDKDYFDYASFWHRSLCVANYALTINSTVNQLSTDQNDTSYLSGLLHNIGHLVIASCLPKGHKQIALESNQELSFEQLLGIQSFRLGINNLEASAFLAKLWKLPGATADVLDTLSMNQSSKSETTQKVADNLKKACFLYSEIDSDNIQQPPHANNEKNINHIANQINLPADLVDKCYDEFQEMKYFVESTF